MDKANFSIEVQGLPVVALVGRPNVGKSTLFNALSGQRKALVYDMEGVTRDRRVTTVRPELLGKRPIALMDTGGWMPEGYRKGREDKRLLLAIEEQILEGLKQASVILQVVDIRVGLTALDEEIIRYVRTLGKPLILLANKRDTDKQDGLEHDFYSVGANAVIGVSAEHRRYLGDIWSIIEEYLPPEEYRDPDTEELDEAIKICIVGRPNVGKSSFLNCLLNENRSVASPISGTTTDPVDTSIIRGKQPFLLVDTAGIRRHAKRNDSVENLSVIYAKRNLEKADIAFLVLDAQDGITTQDARIAKLVQEEGTAVIIIANKWDSAPENIRVDSNEALQNFAKVLRDEFPALDYAPIVAASAERRKVYAAKMGQDATSATPFRMDFSVDGIWQLVKEIIRSRNIQVPTNALNALLHEAMAAGPNISQNIGKVYFAHRLGIRRPTFCAYVKNPEAIPDSYKRYLVRSVREQYGFRGNPIRWVFKSKGDGRYANK